MVRAGGQCHRHQHCGFPSSPLCAHHSALSMEKSVTWEDMRVEDIRCKTSGGDSSGCLDRHFIYYYSYTQQVLTNC